MSRTFFRSKRKPTKEESRSLRQINKYFIKTKTINQASFSKEPVSHWSDSKQFNGQIPGALSHRCLVLVSDPCCKPKKSIEIDVMGWHMADRVGGIPKERELK